MTGPRRCPCPRGDSRAVALRGPRRRGHLRSYGVAGGQEVRICFAPPIQPRRIKMTKLDRTDAPATTEYATVHLVFELSKARWKLGVMLPGSEKMSCYMIAGGDLAA